MLPVRRLARNGFEAWSEVIAHDYEGLVAKEESSLHEAGRTRRWPKVSRKAGPTQRTGGSGGSALAREFDVNRLIVSRSSASAAPASRISARSAASVASTSRVSTSCAITDLMAFFNESPRRLTSPARDVGEGDEGAQRFLKR